MQNKCFLHNLIIIKCMNDVYKYNILILFKFKLHFKTKLTRFNKNEKSFYDFVYCYFPSNRLFGFQFYATMSQC